MTRTHQGVQNQMSKERLTEKLTHWAAHLVLSTRAGPKILFDELANIAASFDKVPRISLQQDPVLQASFYLLIR